MACHQFSAKPSPEPVIIYCQLEWVDIFKSPRSLTVSSALRSHSGCLLHQGILLTPIPVVPWQSGLLFPRYNLTLKIQGHRQRSKVPQSAQCPDYSFPYCFTSGHPINSCSIRSMTFGPPIPEIQFDLDNSRSKIKVKGTPISSASRWLISLVFHIRASYRLRSLSFHDNWASHSRDTIWP